MHVEASFIGLLRILAIIILAYYSIRFIMRFLAPVLLKMFLKKKGFDVGGRQQKTDEKKRAKSNKSDSNLGEYVDYEEVD